MQDIDEVRLALAKEIFELSSPLLDCARVGVAGRAFQHADELLGCSGRCRLQFAQTIEDSKEIGKSV